MEIAKSVAFYVSFDDETCDADLSVGDNKAAVLGKPVFVPGVSGTAVRGVNLRYQTAKNLQMDKPGSLSMWVRWFSDEPHPEGLSLPWFMTDYKGDGYLGFEPQGKGEQRAMLWFHYFKNLANQSLTFACDLKEKQWQFLVITWRGPRWEVFVDGKRQMEAALPRAVKQEEIHERFMVGAAAIAIDEFTIYRHPLTEEGMKRLLGLASK